MNDTNFGPDGLMIILMKVLLLSVIVLEVSQMGFAGGSRVLNVETEGKGTTAPVPPGTYSEGHWIFEGDGEVTLEALPYEGYSLVEWKGCYDVNLEEKTCDVFVEKGEERTVTAVFGEENHVLRTEVGSGRGTVTPSGTSSFSHGEEVMVDASPASGYRFEGFSGDCSGSSCTVQMTEDRHVVADFSRVDRGEEKHSLRINTEGGGETNPSEGVHRYDDGDYVRVTAESDEGWRFAGFSGDCSGGYCNVRMDRDKEITARFERDTKNRYELKIVSGEGGTTEPDPGIYKFSGGRSVDVRAIPDSGYRLKGFEGKCSSEAANLAGDDRTCTVDVDGYRRVRAEFERVRRSLDVEIRGEGSVSPSEGRHFYEHGESVSFSAEPDDGWDFDGFGGDCSGDECSVDMEDDKKVFAYFDQEDDGREEHELDIEVSGGGESSPSEGVHFYREGSRVRVYHEADDGWFFDGFSGDCSGSSCYLRMDEDKQVSLDFDRKRDRWDEFELDIDVDGGGRSYPSEGVHWYRRGRRIRITAEADDGWFFDGFSGDCSGEECSVDMDGDRYVSLDFDRIRDETDDDRGNDGVDDEGSSDVYDGVDDGGSEYTVHAEDAYSGYEAVTEQNDLNISVVGKGSVSPSEGVRAYSYGRSVDVTADADEGWEFEGFEGDCSGSFCTVQMTEDRKVEAVFRRTGREESVLNGGRRDLEIIVKGDGSVSPSEGTHSFRRYDTVNLDAEPSSGWRFEGWEGVKAGEDTPQVYMDKDRKVVARFVTEGTGEELRDIFTVAENPYDVSVNTALLRGRIYGAEKDYDAVFEYRKQGDSYWTRTDRIKVSDDGFYSLRADGLEQNTTYEYRMAVYGASADSMSEKEFRTKRYLPEEQEIGEGLKYSYDDENGSTVSFKVENKNKSVRRFNATVNLSEDLKNISDEIRFSRKPSVVTEEGVVWEGKIGSDEEQVLSFSVEGKHSPEIFEGTNFLVDFSEVPETGPTGYIAGSFSSPYFMVFMMIMVLVLYFGLRNDEEGCDDSGIFGRFFVRSDDNLGDGASSDVSRIDSGGSFGSKDSTGLFEGEDYRRILEARRNLVTPQKLVKRRRKGFWYEEK